MMPNDANATSDNGVPLPGRADVCAICAAPLEEAPDVGLFGVNAAMCTGCTSLINRLTPRWWCLCLEDDTDIKIYQYGVRPESPFFDAASIPTFVDLPSVEKNSPEAVIEFYHGLREELKDLLWFMTVGTVPDSFKAVSGEGLTQPDILDVHQAYREVESENAYRIARSYIPRPYLVTPNEILADFSTRQEDAERVERILSGNGQPGQESLSEFNVSDSEPRCENTSTRKSSNTANSNQQATLTNFDA
ncbi:hypothetical protein [Salinibaculum rarum]|uniref:hypothetical protein n=1 Tax=Salinibaculum rarum TaxID=3058903 RepID=UPI00265FC474|nr:hypothetical protein [Salinibaculum sp. KK48]